jgi:hypothetical protein
MKRSRKILLAVLLSALVLAGSIGGIALASDDEEDTGPADGFGNLIEKVSQIYQEKTGTALDTEKLEESFIEARNQIKSESRDRFRQRLIDEGRITQEQLDEFDKWLESKPDFPTDEFREWMESKPDFPTDEYKEWMESIPEGLPFGPGMRGHDGHFFGFKRFGGGLRGWCVPDVPAE